MIAASSWPNPRSSPQLQPKIGDRSNPRVVGMTRPALDSRLGTYKKVQMILRVVANTRLKRRVSMHFRDEF